MYFSDEKLYKKSIGVKEQRSFAIYSFEEVLECVKKGCKAKREGWNMTISKEHLDTITICEDDLLAQDWVVIKSV